MYSTVDRRAKTEVFKQANKYCLPRLLLLRSLLHLTCCAKHIPNSEIYGSGCFSLTSVRVSSTTNLIDSDAQCVRIRKIAETRISRE